MEKKELNKKQVQEELFKLYLNNLEEAARTVDVIIPVIRQYDDKVYNARLANAIRKELEDRQIDVCFDIAHFDDNHLEINLNFYRMDKRCVCYTEVENSKENRCAYIPSSYETIRIAWCYDYVKGTKTRNDGKWLYYDANYNRRIVASVIIQCLQDRQKELREQIEKLKQELTNLDSYNIRLARIKKDLEMLNEEIPYQFRDFFGLKCHAQWS